MGIYQKILNSKLFAKINGLPILIKIILKILVIAILLYIFVLIINISKDHNFLLIQNREEKERECFAEYYDSNSYDEGSGHYAGWEWANKNTPKNCDGKSTSFIEGCSENLKAHQQLNECLYYASLED